MKYGIISDLHLDHWHPVVHNILIEKINASDADLILNAGDLYEDPNQRNRFHSQFKKPYIFVHGNHDYYGSKFGSDFGKDPLYPVVYATLWTNFRENTLCEDAALRYINDFRLIEHEGKPLSTDIVKQNFYLALYYLQTEGQDKDIVMTHFGPHIKSVDPKFGNSLLDGYFINDLSDNEINQMQKKLWVHGHTHSEFDYMIGNTRVISHPLGYPKENYVTVEDYEVKIVEI